MFKQDHTADFESIMVTQKPFALIRFGDGELALLDGIAHQSADAWSTEGVSWMRDELIASLRTELDGVCLGLPCPCCISRGLRLRASVRLPLHAQTFATLFMHGNLPRAYEIQEHFKDAVVVSGEYGDVRVPRDGVTSPWDVDAVVSQLLDVRDRPILLAAGPCSNIIALRYWKRQRLHDRVPIIDVGSMLDVLRGNVNRHYHGRMNNHHCIWNERDRPHRSGSVAQQDGGRTAKIQVGRPGPSGDATKIQSGSRQPSRATKIQVGRPRASGEATKVQTGNRPPAIGAIHPDESTSGKVQIGRRQPSEDATKVQVSTPKIRIGNR